MEEYIQKLLVSDRCSDCHCPQESTFSSKQKFEVGGGGSGRRRDCVFSGDILPPVVWSMNSSCIISQMEIPLKNK